jgi:steroid delta-isomerase-like uncharacterized protein
MSPENNKELVRRVIEDVFNKQNLAAANQYLSPNFVHHDFPMSKSGPEEFARIFQAFLTAFPDGRVTIEDCIAEGDRVFSRGTYTGTHKGAFQGIPPTGRKIDVRYMDEWRIGGDGKATDNWARIDMLTLMQQLGVVPAPK